KGRPGTIGSAGSQVLAEILHQLSEYREPAIALAGFHRLQLATPYAPPNVNDGILQIQIINPQSTNLTAADSSFGQNHVERAVRITGRSNHVPDFLKR